MDCIKDYGINFCHSAPRIPDVLRLCKDVGPMGDKKIRRIQKETANQLWNLYFLTFSIIHSCFFVALS